MAGALEALDAPALRALVGDVLKDVDQEVGARIVRRLVELAARAPSGWTPAAMAHEDVSEVIAAVKSAARAGYADPVQVVEWLDRGSRAFLRRGYAAARGLFEAVLQPVLEAEIDVGQHEMVDEVLSADLDACATQLAVSVYMLSAPEERASAVRAALASTDATWYPRTPVVDMERVAVEPLPDLAAFLPRWRAVVESEITNEAQRGYGRAREWLHEVAARLEGVDGLARMAGKPTATPTTAPGAPRSWKQATGRGRWRPSRRQPSGYGARTTCARHVWTALPRPRSGSAGATLPPTASGHGGRGRRGRASHVGWVRPTPGPQSGSGRWPHWRRARRWRSGSVPC